jgi:ABC-type glutathione transport system ATPase component
MTTLLDISDLSVSYVTEHGMVEALRHAHLEAKAGEVVGIVGESGSGKSTLIAAIANLLPANARTISGAIRFKGTDIVHLDAEAQRKLRGQEIAMVFQDPMTAFNPVLTIGEQLIDFSSAVSVAVKSAAARFACSRESVSPMRKCGSPPIPTSCQAGPDSASPLPQLSSWSPTSSLPMSRRRRST